MKQFFWKHMARLLARPAIANALISYAMKHPYMHLPSNEDPSYMARYWVFNPYDRTTNKPKYFFWPWSVRVHHIKRADYERDLHDHPWNARTIILKGWYKEKRLATGAAREQILEQCLDDIEKVTVDMAKVETSFHYTRLPGDTAELGFGEYHSINEVDPDGAWTLFISGPWRGVWGFLVDDVKIPWKKYLGIPEKGDLSEADASKSMVKRPDTDLSEGSREQWSIEKELRDKGFHTGGYVNAMPLRDGEVPAILQHGRYMAISGEPTPLEAGEKVVIAEGPHRGPITVNVVNASDDEAEMVLLRGMLQGQQERRARAEQAVKDAIQQTGYTLRLLPDNLLSHRRSWLNAMERLVELEQESFDPESEDLKAYWEHEQKAMQDMYADLDRMSPVVPDDGTAWRIPEDGSKWRHYNGMEYQVLMITNLDSTRPEYPTTVVYVNTMNGKRWSRPLSEWHRSMTEVPDDAHQ
jgi:hypothetical protein